MSGRRYSFLVVGGQRAPVIRTGHRLHERPGARNHHAATIIARLVPSSADDGACPHDPDGEHSSVCGCDWEQGRDVSGLHNRAEPDIDHRDDPAQDAQDAQDAADWAEHLLSVRRYGE